MAWYDLGSGWRYSPWGALYRYRRKTEAIGPGVLISKGVIQRKLRFTLRRKNGRPRVGRN